MSQTKELMFDKMELPDGIVKVVMGSIKDKSTGLIKGGIELDFATNGRLVDFVEKIINDGNHKIVFDMANIDRVDSSGMWAAFECHKKVIKFNGTMAIINIRKQVYTTFESVCMTNQVNIFETEEEAVSFLKGDK